MNRLALQFLEYVRRDIFVYSQRVMRYLVNYILLYVFFYGTCFGYLLSSIGMEGRQSSSVMMVGTILFGLSGLSFSIIADFLFDIDRERCVDYQLTQIPYWLIILEKIIFGGCLVFVCVVGYYPYMKLLFPSYLNLSEVSYVMTIISLFLSSMLMMAFYVFFASLITDTRKVRLLFRRITYPMIMLGGFLVPWKIMAAYSSVFGYLILLNPFLYITEGLRHAMLGGDFFLPISLSIVAMILWIGIFTMLAIYCFKRKMDAV